MSFRFWAFISYSHRDTPVANWLHRKLEQYRIPKRLIGRATALGDVPPRLFPIFKDREELPVSSSLDENIQTALRESRFLIVICSPGAAQSHWVNEEIRLFKSLGREGRVLSLIASGEPNATDKGLPDLEECFPAALRFRVDENGDLTDQRVEPVAADLRPGKEGRNLAVLKVVAGLLGVNFDELRQRDKVRRNQSIGIWALGSAVVATLVVALVIQGNREKGARIRATNQVATEKVKVSAKESETKLSAGLRLVEEGDFESGVAFMAKALRHNPSNQAAVAALSWSLTERPFPVRKALVNPTAPAIEPKPASESDAEISPLGTYRVEEIDQDAVIRNLKTGQVDRQRVGSVYGSSFEFTSDERFLLIENPAATTYLWDLNLRAPVMSYVQMANGHGLFSPDSKYLFVSEGDRGMLVDLADSPVVSARFRLPPSVPGEWREWFEGRSIVVKQGSETMSYEIPHRPLMYVGFPETLDVSSFYRPLGGARLMLEGASRGDDYVSDWILDTKSGERTFIYGHQDSFTGMVSSNGRYATKMTLNDLDDVRLVDLDTKQSIIPRIDAEACFQTHDGQGIFMVQGGTITLFRVGRPSVSFASQSSIDGLEPSPNGTMVLCKPQGSDARVLGLGEAITDQITIPGSAQFGAFFWMNDNVHIVGIDLKNNSMQVWSSLTGQQVDPALIPEALVDRWSYFSQNHGSSPYNQFGGQILSGNRILVTRRDVMDSERADLPVSLIKPNQAGQSVPLTHPEASEVVKGSISYDGRFAASLDAEGRGYLWDVEAEKRIVKMPGKVVDIAFSPDSRFALVLTPTGVQNRYLGLVGREDIPAWLPDLAEYLANRRLDESDEPVQLTQRESRRTQLDEAIAKEPADSEWRIFAEALLGLRPGGLGEDFG